MTANGERSPDEQVYQDNKHEPAITEVYSNETATSGDDVALSNPDPSLVTEQDEASAESFPASDPPATTPTVPATPDKA